MQPPLKLDIFSLSLKPFAIIKLFVVWLKSQLRTKYFISLKYERLFKIEYYIRNKMQRLEKTYYGTYQIFFFKSLSLQIRRTLYLYRNYDLPNQKSTKFYNHPIIYIFLHWNWIYWLNHNQLSFFESKTSRTHNKGFNMKKLKWPIYKCSFCDKFWHLKPFCCDKLWRSKGNNHK